MIKLKRADLNQKYSISEALWKRRHDELLDHLQDYMDIHELRTHGDKGQFFYVIKGELPETIPPLPRKSQMKEKLNDYKDFTIVALGKDFKPNSKSKIAREAIEDFGAEKYGHKSVRAVADRYVGPNVDEYGESNNIYHWVNYYTYEDLTDEEKRQWVRILQEEHISEAEQAEAFQLMQQGEDISRASSYYKRAIDRMNSEYCIIPIKVKEWKLKGD